MASVLTYLYSSTAGMGKGRNTALSRRVWGHVEKVWDTQYIIISTFFYRPLEHNTDSSFQSNLIKTVHCKMASNSSTVIRPQFIVGSSLQLSACMIDQLIKIIFFVPLFHSSISYLLLQHSSKAWRSCRLVSTGTIYSYNFNMCLLGKAEQK